MNEGSKQALFSSAKDDWETPQDFFDGLDAEFKFTLDAAADETNHKSGRYYTKEQDGLTQDWAGETVFVNPPYGRKETGRWVEKAYNESRKPGTKMVMLLRARTDTRWFHEYLYGKAGIRFIRSRLKIGGSSGNAPFPSMVVILAKGAENEQTGKAAYQTVTIYRKQG